MENRLLGSFLVDIRALGAFKRKKPTTGLFGAVFMHFETFCHFLKIFWLLD
jgi:hypothetical protein